MNAESKLMTTRGGAEIIEYVQPQDPAPQPAKPANPLLVVHSLLRGRYPWAIGLALLGAAIGAPVGYLLQKPEYKSSGIIQIQPYVPQIMTQTPENGTMPAFDQFVQAQAALIRSKRVTGEAMTEPEWKAFGRGMLPSAEAAFQQSVEVTIPKSTSMINVAFTDHDPRAAAAAVTAITRRYKDIADKAADEQFEKPMAALERMRVELQNEISNLTKEIYSISNELMSASPKDDYEAKRVWLNELQRQLGQLKVQGVQASTAAPTTAPTSQPAELPVGALALKDATLATLQAQRLEADRQARMLLSGYGANHQKVKDANLRVKLLDDDINARAAQLRQILGLSPGGAVPANAKLSGAEQINPEALQQLFTSVKQETEKLGARVNRIEELREAAAAKQERLDEVKRRIEARNLERQQGGRVEVMSVGDVPFAPSKDRRKAMAAVGGIGLAGLGVGVVLLLGFLDRRMHHIETARSRLKPAERLLGVLPELPSDFADPVAAADTAHCVHRIRAMLQIRQRVTGHKVYTITSPAPGDGKTSLTITLGMSLASSGCRTLLIDCDMDGGGLSAKLGRKARRPLGQILLDMGVIGEAGLQDAVELGREQRTRLGAALVQLGHVTQLQVDQALRAQRASAPGLREVLSGEPLENAVHSTAYPLMSVLPLGVATGTHVGKLAPEAFHRLLQRAGEHYDLILIDCGPILGSVEAAIVSAEADGVVLLVSRGGDRKAAENAVGLLTAAGASIEGVVFNRALPEDLVVSGYSSSSSRRSNRSDESRPVAASA